ARLGDCRTTNVILAISDLVIPYELRPVTDLNNIARFHLAGKEFHFGMKVVEPLFNLVFGISAALALYRVEGKVSVYSNFNCIIEPDNGYAPIKVTTNAEVRFSMKKKFEWT